MIAYPVKLKFRSKEHELYWKQFLEISTLAYNDIALKVFESKCPLSIKPVHALVYNYIREKYPSMPSQGVIRMEKDVISALRSCKSSKHYNHSCPVRTNPCIQLDERLYCHLTTNSIKLPSPKFRHREIVDFITYPKFDELASKYVMKAPLLYIKNNEIYLSIPFDIPEKPLKNESRLGVDLGIRRIFTTSDGLAYKGNDLNRIKRKLRYLKRKLSSKGTKSTKRKLKKLKHKEQNINKNYTHLIANKILDTDKSIIVLEDLKGLKKDTAYTKEGFKRKKHNNRISQIPLFELRRILTYKAPLLGKRVETVSPSYTSQIDCLTGKKDGLRKGCRYYSKKGIILDADWNAAINIRDRYSRHSQPFEIPIDGKLNFMRQAVCQPANRSLEEQVANS